MKKEEDAIQGEAQEQEKKQSEPSAEEKLQHFREAMRSVENGKLKLAKPILSGGEEKTEIIYDFSKITGKQYLKAMDVGAPSRDMNNITNTQAFELFLAAAGKMNEGLDVIDLRERMAVDDVLQATRIGKLFFAFKANEGDTRMQKA
jgi:hypothetical protein